jgi:hypothetical protein
LLEALKPSESDPAAAKISALPAAGKTLRTALESEDLKPALRFIGNTDLPTIEAKPVETETLGELLQAIRSRVPETKTESLVAKIPPGAVEAAIETATSNADAFDRACEPVVKSVRTLEKAVGDVDRLASGVAEPSNEIKSLAGAVHGAALSLRFAAQDLTARRYDREAKFNQQIAELYEIQVRLAGHESERHRLRSKNFFYAMLFAQAGVTIASLALAKSRQSAFWFIAGLAGLAAVATGAYVYLAM